MDNKAILGCLLLFLISCKNEMKFDKAAWNMSATDPISSSPFREKMLIDLTTNYTLKGLKYNQLVEFLGIPNTVDSSSLSYNLDINYGSDIDPVYAKYLEFQFSKDSVITSFKIEEWKE
jgi:hypothetical protein